VTARSVKKTELITCAITCYNAEQTIGRAIESALAQKWPEVEVIVVDDNSMDGSVAVIEEMARAEQRLQLIQHKENMGPGAARQTLLAEARGEFIAFFDDDDESLPTRLQLQYERIKSFEAGCGAQSIMCYGSGERLYPNGYRLGLIAIGSQPRPPQGEEIVDYLLYNRRRSGIFYGAGPATCSLMAPASVLKAAGGFDPRFRRVEDADLAIRVGLMGGAFIGCPEFVFRQHASLGNDKSARINARAELKLVRKYASYLRRQGRYRYASRWILVRYFHFSGQRWAMVRALWSCLCCNPAYLTGHLLRSAPNRLIHELRMK